MAGSERILRVHHKNTIHSRALDLHLDNLDLVCRRNVNKITQQIHDIYYQELLPLRKVMGTTKRQEIPTRGHSEDFRVDDYNLRHQKLLDTKRRGVVTPIQHNRKNVKVTKCVLPPINHKPSQNCRIGLCRHDSNMEPWKRLTDGRREPESPTEYKSVSIYESSSINSSPLPAEESKLQVIKRAIALTSQKLKCPKVKKKSNALSKSFLINLRRQSKAVWEMETIQRVIDSFEANNSFNVRSCNIRGTYDYEDDTQGARLDTQSLCDSSDTGLSPCSSDVREHFPHTAEFTAFDFDENECYSSTPDIFGEIEKISKYSESIINSESSLLTSESGSRFGSEDSFN